jgi:hypothetical protein
MKIVATTTQSRSEPEQLFRQFLDDSGFDYWPRKGRGIKTIQRESQADVILVWQENGPVIYMGDDRLFFHPSMAKVRLSAYRNKGQTDPLIEAAGITPGDSVLDCTLGLGADSIVMAYFCQGPVLALETSSAIAYTVKWGMQLYNSVMPWLDEAIKRVNVMNRDYLSYLLSLPDRCYDVVYFDPMFRKPLFKSKTLSPVRMLGDHEPLSPEAVREACRVAKKRVLIKERAGSPEFQRLGCCRTAGSVHNQVHFGIIDIER